MNITEQIDVFFKLAQGIPDPIRKQLLAVIDNIESVVAVSSPVLWALKSQINNIDAKVLVTHLKALITFCEQNNIKQFNKQIFDIISDLQSLSTPSKTEIPKSAPTTPKAAPPKATSPQASPVKQTSPAKTSPTKTSPQKKEVFSTDKTIKELNGIKQKLYDDSITDDSEVDRMFLLLDKLLDRRDAIESNPNFRNEYDSIEGTLDIFAHIHETVFMKNERAKFYAFKARYRRA